ncbi:MAG: HAMP domain-containing protein, partial [Gammaproteobacteria bacterium]
MTLNPPSLVGRLTLRYTAYSTLLFVIVMIVAYFLTGQVLTGQVDADLIEDIEEFSETLRERGEVELWQELQAEVNSDGQLQILFQLYAMSGELLRNTDNGTWQNFNVSNDWPTSLAEDGYALSTVELQTHEFPARTIIGVLDSQSERVLLINESLEERAMVLEVLRLTFMLSLPLIVIGSLLGGRQMARKSLQGVQQVTDTAIDISNGDLSKRVQLNDQGIEIDRLAETFNSMLD